MESEGSLAVEPSLARPARFVALGQYRQWVLDFLFQR
jgi:hypothetical protein